VVVRGADALLSPPVLSVQVAGLAAAPSLPRRPQANIRFHNSVGALVVHHRSAVGLLSWLGGAVGVVAVAFMVRGGVTMVLLPALMMMVAPVVKLLSMRVGVVVVRSAQIECGELSMLDAWRRTLLGLEPMGPIELSIVSAQIKDIFVEPSRRPHRGWRVQLRIGNGLTQVVVDDLNSAEMAERVAVVVRTRIGLALAGDL
jgi:hypothetical protein